MLHRPVLLILDPLVRLHAIDENAAGEIAALLGYLRLLQRKTGAAIALVHHARKNVSANSGAGYSLRVFVVPPMSMRGSIRSSTCAGSTANLCFLSNTAPLLAPVFATGTGEPRIGAILETAIHGQCC